MPFQIDDGAREKYAIANLSQPPPRAPGLREYSSRTRAKRVNANCIHFNQTFESFRVIEKSSVVVAPRDRKNRNYVAKLETRRRGLRISASKKAKQELGVRFFVIFVQGKKPTRHDQRPSSYVHF